MRRILFWFGLAYAAFCTLLISGLPRNKYEWMLDDPAMRADELTFCTLPIDESAASSEFISLAFVIPLLAAAITLSIRRRKIHLILWLGLGLLALWAMRFFVFSPNCAMQEII